MEIFVGNLSFESTEGDVKRLFEGFGNVASAVILKRKEKKAPKSRGFGFVNMPDEQQALAAIAGINGKEFMGRALSVEPARPKAEAQAESKPGKKREPEVRVRPFERHLALSDGKCALSGQPKPGTYKGGRRSLSYMKRQGLAGAEQETNPRRRNQENPMRWRKRRDQPRPWQKSPGEHKPWEKARGEARPWKKTEGARPWKKTEGGFKPWRKSEGGIKPRKKTGGYVGKR